MTEIAVVNERTSGWTRLDDLPGEIPSRAWEIDAWTSVDGRVTTGLWRREPDTWAFERPHDEVALILSGAAEIVTDDVRVLSLGPGAVLTTPMGSKGTWRITETLTKFFATYAHDEPPTNPQASMVASEAELAWSVLDNPPGDTNPPGEEVVVSRSADGRFVTGFWRRGPETGAFEREYDEIAILQEGEVDFAGADGRSLAVGPGDVLVTPLGASGVWRARSAVRKFWVVYHSER